MRHDEKKPSIDEWLSSIKEEAAREAGMILIHNGIVRQTPKAKVRQGIDDGSSVTGMEFSYDAQKVAQAIEETKKMEGIVIVKAWLNDGFLHVGDDIMYVLVAGDIRPHVVKALEFLVERIKTVCVTEIEQKE